MKSEIKKNIQETNSERKETGFRSMFGNRRKKQIFNQNRMKKQELKKMRRGLGTSGTTLNVPTSESQGCQKEKRKTKHECKHIVLGILPSSPFLPARFLLRNQLIV